MKSFIDFLKESKIEEQMDSVLDQKIYSITESGIEPVKEEESFEDMDFLDIADMIMNDRESVNEDSSTDEIETGFGGEVYISLDTPELMNDDEVENVDEAKRKTDTEDSKTLKDLKSRRDNNDDEDMEKVIDRNLRYTIGDDGFTLLVKDGDSGKRRPITQEEADEIVNRKNSENHYANKSHYEFSTDGRLMTVSNTDPEDRQETPKRYRNGLLKKLNDKVNADGIHYKWENPDESSKMMVNTTSWDDSDVRDETRFDKAEYRPLETSQDFEKVLDKLNKKKSENKNPKDKIGYENGHFTKNGTEMNRTELDKFVKTLNGQVGGETALLNPKAWGKKKVPYWESYKISIAGSKVGDAINFNLPPVQTCHKKVLPCAKLCYAVKAYAAYPAVRGAEDCNFALLKKDKNFELFKKSMIYALNTPKKGGKRFNLCRIHVSGDFYSKEYLMAICDIAKECKHVNFWLYTKQYEILSEVGKSAIPDNLCVIVSCWGDYNPIAYERKEGEKVGPYAQLAKDFPLAYLDDGSEEFKKFNDEMQEYLGKPKDVQYCPCTTAEQIVTRCESCKICFDKSLANNNLVFKLH